VSDLGALLRAEAFRLAKFGVVGVFATAIHTSVALLVLHRGFSPFAANVTGFLTAFGFSFLGQSLWTFGMRTRRKRAAVRFFVVAVSSFLFSNVALGAAKASGLLPDWLSLLIAIGVIPISNFLLGRLWAFRES
jgi:putative flippase GtrA